MQNEATTRVALRARLGRRVPEHVYLDGRPLFTAATPEIAAEVVRLLNAEARIFGFLAEDKELSRSSKTETLKKPRRSGPSPKAIADAAVAIINTSHRPLKRREILSELIERGIPIEVKNPVNYVGVQLWRYAKDRVQACEGGGFRAIDLTKPVEG